MYFVNIGKFRRKKTTLPK